MQVLEQAINATKGLDQEKLAAYIHKNEFDTFVGKVRFAQNGEWAQSRVIMTQYHSISGNDVEQFKKPGKVTVLYPKEYRTGEREGALPREQEVGIDNNAGGKTRRLRFSAMEISTALLFNAIIAGLLLGGFYAAVSVGVSISFGMLDVVNIAHPAFIILGSYIAYIVNSQLRLRPDPDRGHALAAVLPAGNGSLPRLLPVLRAARTGVAARARVFLRHPVHHRGRADSRVRRGLPHGADRLRRHDLAAGRARLSAAPRGAVPDVDGDGGGHPAVSHAHLLRPRRARGRAGSARAAADGRQSGPRQGARVRAFDRHRRASRARS